MSASTTISDGQPLTAARYNNLRTDMLNAGGGVVNVKDPAYGAIGDGVTDDTTAIQNALNVTGTIVLPDGTYKIGSAGLAVAENTTIQCTDAASLLLNGSVKIGSTSANNFRVGAALRVKPDSGYTGTLVECYNLFGSVANRAIAVELAGSANSNDLIHIHSINGKGAADVTYLITTNQYSSNNGIVLINGDDGTTASGSGDFVNGNLFFQAILYCTNICLKVHPTGPVGGSVSGNIARNKFLRCDWEAYTGTGAAVKCVTGTGFSYNEFDTCTFEHGGSTLDVDLTGNVGGNYWRHIRSRSKATQTMPGAREVWMDTEGTDAGWDMGFYGIKANNLGITNKSQVVPSSATTTSTAFVSQGAGTSGGIAPNWLAQLEVIFNGEVLNGTINDGAAVAIYRNTTGVPADEGAVGADTQVWASNTLTAVAASEVNYVSCHLYDTGLVNSTTYYYYVALKAVTGGTATVQNHRLIVREA